MGEAMGKVLAGMAAGLMLVTGAQAACELPDVVGSPYPQAREAMIKAGWMPQRQPGTMGDRAPYTPWVHARLYDEVDACSGSGLAPCNFVFMRDGERVVVTTIYEELGEVSGFRCG